MNYALFAPSAGRKNAPRVPHGQHPRPFEPAWSAASTTATDSTFHQLAPYIGRMKTLMARSLVSAHSRKGDLIVDPFCGCGVVPFEAAASGRRVLAGDWNPYAVVLTRAKLFPPASLMAAQ